jgi:hypothetical protein
MNNTRSFTFQMPVTRPNRYGKIVLADTITINAVAYLYKDGSVRLVEIETVHDSDNQDITKWTPFMEFDLKNELEEAALAHITGLLEEPEFEMVQE